jgi:hypothetical protein
MWHNPYKAEKTMKKEQERRIKEVIERYREFVLRNAGGNLYSPDEKDEKLTEVVEEIVQICSDS